MSQILSAKDDAGEVPRAVLPPRLGWFDATMLIVGSMIGSGIFLSPSIMATYLQTPGLLLGLWVFGGLFTMLGVLACAELAAMSPKAGGPYVFLREAYGPLWGFLYGWTLFLVIQTGFNAAVAIAFFKYLGVFLPALSEKNVLVSLAWPAFEITTAQVAACGVIALLTFVNCLGVRQGAVVQNVFTVLKVAALGAIVAGGLANLPAHLDHFQPLLQPIAGPAALKTGVVAGLALALSKALFAYDAWNTATFVAEEVREPERNLPRALLAGTVAVTLIYVLTNVAYLSVLSIDEMAVEPGNLVARAVAIRLFGAAGLALFVIAVLVSTFGCLNGLILSGARVLFAMAREGLFFRGCARLHPHTQVPVIALVVQAVWSCVLTLTGSYSALLTYVIFASVFFGALMVAGVYRLRALEPNRPRPYRCWGYPVTPALYLAIALPFLVYLLQADIQSTGIGALLIASGVPVYFWWTRAARNETASG